MVNDAIRYVTTVRRTSLVGTMAILAAGIVGPLTPVASGQTAAAVAGPATVRASVAGRDREGGRLSASVTVSNNGRYVVFSSSSRFVRQDRNRTIDVYLRDRRAHVTTLVSRTSTGAAGNQGSFFPAMTPDGRFVAFVSLASNLVPGDRNGVLDIFVRDLSTGTTERVSVADDGSESTDHTVDGPDLSADGRFVTFSSQDPGLAPGGVPGLSAVYVRDRLRDRTTRVSVNSEEVAADANSDDASISSDGRYIEFTSLADNLVADDTRPLSDVFVRDRVAGTTQRVSVGPGGVQANRPSGDADISGNGLFVVFRSEATNLVPNDTNRVEDVFVRDLAAGATLRVSVSSDERQAGAVSFLPSISASGRYVAFSSEATDLVEGDTNGATDAFVRDLLAETTQRVSLSTQGAQGNDSSSADGISANGRHVAFESHASNLVEGDTNETIDAFVRLRFAG